MGTKTALRRERIEVSKRGNTARVRFVDRKILDEKLIEQLGAELFELVEGTEGEFILNFTDVDFLSSAVIGKLITLEEMVTAVNKKLALCGLRPEIYEVFAITKLNRFFSIADNPKDALKLLRRKGVSSEPAGPLD